MSTEENKKFENFESQNEMFQFFNRNLNQQYFDVTHKEFVQIFGKGVNEDNLIKLNKNLVYTHLDFYNYAYDKTWKYKWYPLYGLFVFNTVRLRSISIIGSYVYLSIFDYMVLPYYLYKAEKERVISIQNAFQYHLVKDQYKEIRSQYLKNYIDIVNGNIQQGLYQRGGDKDKAKIVFGRQSFSQETNHQVLLSQIKLENQKTDGMIFWDNLKEIYQKLKRNELNLDYLKSMYTPAANTLLQSPYESNISFLEYLTTEFRNFKKEYPFMMKQNQYNSLLNYEEINGQKVYNLKDQIREKAESFLSTFYYVFKNQIKPIKIPIKLLHREPTQIPLRYKVENFLPEFIVFSTLMILPVKAFQFRKLYLRIKKTVAQYK